MGKLVKCARGRIFDAGVDVRRGSPTFGQWYGEVLTGENHKMFEEAIVESEAQLEVLGVAALLVKLGQSRRYLFR